MHTATGEAIFERAEGFGRYVIGLPGWSTWEALSRRAAVRGSARLGYRAPL